MIQRSDKRPPLLGWAMSIFATLFQLLVVAVGTAQEDTVVDGKKLAMALSNLESLETESMPLVKQELLQQFEGKPPTQERCIAELFIALMDEDHEGISKGLGTYAGLTDEPPDELRRTVGKLSLCLSLRELDATRAQTLYKSLVKGAMRDETPLASRRDMVRMVGFINGLFLHNESSPIPQDVLQRGESLLMSEKRNGLVSTYTASRENGAARQNFVAEQLEVWNDFTPEERSESLASTRNELQSLRSEYDEKLAATRDEHADQQSAFKGIFQSSKRMMGELGIVIDEQNTPTSGHPGPPPIPPEVPKKSKVQVDEYENKREKKGDKWETVRVKRDKNEIEQERERKFNDWQIRYSRDKERYDRLDQAFRQAMAAWVIRDQVRRQDLAIKRSDLETRLAQLNQQQANLQIAKKAAMQELEHLDERLNALEKLASVHECVHEAIETKDEGLAYRASAWESIDFALEKNQLLRCLRNNDTLP